jgi:hypothetical protein
MHYRATFIGAVTLALAGAFAAPAASAASGTPRTAAPTGLTQPYECSSGDQLAMRLGYSGPNQVATTDQVSLSSAEPAGSMAGDTPMSASASLGLGGETSGSIPLALGMPDGKLALTGVWQPQSSGLFRLTAPSRFSVRLRKTSTTVTVECVATTVTTVTTTVRVSASSMSSTAAQGIAAAEGGSTAAPDTGGGGSLHSPIDVTLLVVGLIAGLGGIGLIVIAIRRRTGGTLTL